MKIKDIRQFRTFFKNSIRSTKDTNRDEHFIGTKHYEEGSVEPVFGFFDLYHGQKSKGVVDGIKGFLKGFLDMAQDAQAVYEFLQNAVDANSSHFIMIWGEDENEVDEDGNAAEYLLVINNGWQFDFASIESILNVGVSTKTEEEHTIGKFGIGFKLAHRLVGKENGLDELLDKNYGPLLFSWNNNELRDLVQNDLVSVIPISQEYDLKIQNGDHRVSILTEEPWFFKILITNFPTQPDEEIKDAYYNKTNTAFTLDDVKKLRSWLVENQDTIPFEEYKTGSLFFLKLGAGKRSKLDDDNLGEGIRFSLSILNKVSDSKVRGLSKVFLNGKDIEHAALEFESFIVPKESEDYRYIRFGKRTQLNKEEQKIADSDSHIQFLFGYTDHKTAEEMINNVPNFYLFFPLSEEKHKLKFILHTNAFYKKSARTSLHSDPINTRLLEVFAQKLVNELTFWSTDANTENRSKFLEVYATLLLTEESLDTDKAWINKPLVSEIHRFLKANIPVLLESNAGFKIEADWNKVKVRSTELDIDPAEYGFDFSWFYFGKDEQLLGAVDSVLGLTEFTILDLLYKKGISIKLNNLLKSNSLLIPVILKEINTHIAGVTGTNTSAEIFKENFHDLEIFEFDNGEFKSINGLRESEADIKYLLLFEEIESIKEQLVKSGFNCTKESLSKYSQIQDFIRKRQSVSYNDYKVLNEYLSTGFEKANLTIEEKHIVFQTLEKAKDKESEVERNQRMQVLRLFANAQGDIVALESLLKQATKPWLKPFEINSQEKREYLYRYLIEKEEEAYTRIVIPLWENVIADKKGLIRNDMKSFYRDIISFQETTKQTQTLANKVFIPTSLGFSPVTTSVYYQPDWASLSNEEYTKLTGLFKKLFKKELPTQDALPYLKQAPFSLNTSLFESLSLEVQQELGRDELIILAKAASIGKLPLFEKFIIVAQSSSFLIRNKLIAESQVWCNTGEKAIEDHINQFHKNLIIAPHLEQLKNLIKLKEKELATHFISEWDEAANELFNDSLTEVVITQEDSVKVLFLDKFGNLSVNLLDLAGYKRLKNAVKVSLTFVDLTIPQDILYKSISVLIGDGRCFGLKDVINSSSDSIYFGEANEYHLKLSEIFSSEETGYSKYLETLIEKLNKDDGYDKTKLNKLFNLEDSESKEDVLSRIFNSVMTNGYLANASQLSFVLLYKKFGDKNIDLSSYNLKQKDQVIKLAGTYAVSDAAFNLFKPESYLDSLYQDIAGHLKLSKSHAFFKVESVSIYLQPVIENNTFLGPELRENISPEEQIVLLDFLLEFNRNSNLLVYNPSWSKVFGFDPHLYVSSKYALKGVESLPEHLSKWSLGENNEDIKKYKASLLAALGFNLPWSPINTLRSVLVNKDSDKTFTIPELSFLPKELVANTLLYIKAVAPDFKFNTEHKYFDLLKEIIRISIHNRSDQSPLPVCTTSINEFVLREVSIEKIYYYDNNKYHELEKFQLSVYDLISIAEACIYDATTWVDTQELKSKLSDILIDEEYDNELIGNIREEWGDTFYYEWKQKNESLSIYYYDSLPIKLSLDGKYIKTINKPLYYFHENSIYCPRIYSFNEATNTLKKTTWISKEQIDELIRLHNVHQMRVNELLNNPIPDDEIRKLVENKKKELEEIAKKKELKENLARNDYSFKWFLSLLELLMKQENESDNSHPEQEISFFNVERDRDSKRLLNFKDPNRSVTPTIEYCTDFSAIFLFDNRKPIEVKIIDVSKKGQTLNALLAKPEILADMNLDDIKRIDIKFSRSINLIQRLYNGFVRLGAENEWDDTFNLKENLSHNIKFVFGPPGTGKTTTIAKRLTEIMKGESDKKVLVLTPTNKAADVLTQRIMDITGDDDYWLVRYGATFSNDIIEKGLLQNKDSFIYEAYSKCVCISTIHRIPYEKATLKIEDGEPILSELGNMHWDYIVFDEASMISLPYIMYSIYKCGCLYVNKVSQYWVAGDPFQIPPVIEIDDEDLPVDFNKEANIYTMVGLESFNEDEQKKVPIYGGNGSIENLKVQYRSIEQIGLLFSKFSYNDDLIHYRATLPDGRKMPRPLPLAVKKMGIKPITLLKFPVNLDDSIYTPSKLRKSAYHTYSAILVLEMIRKFNDAIEKGEEWNIGIVCPYRSQATLVNKMIESLELKSSFHVITDTVHGFQGDECDLVFFIVNPPGHSISSPGYGAFIHKHFLINVAISRAKDYLVIVCPDDDTKEIRNLVKIHKASVGSIENILSNKMHIDLNEITIHSKDIEREIFGKVDFIQQESRVNKHQLVNVYNAAQRTYNVRESSTAIDIQIKG